MLNRILSAIGLEKRSTIGVNGWPVPLSASAVTPATACIFHPDRRGRV